jgi:signal transduction histidine kinase
VKVQRLAEIPLLGVLSTHALSTIEGRLTPRGAAAGEKLFEQGDPPGDLYLLEEGSVDVVLRVGAEELVLSTLEATTFFGEMSFVDEQPRSSGIRVRSAARLLCVPQEVLTILRRIDPIGLSEFYRRLFVVRSERLRQANAVIGRYYSDLLERRGLDELDRELRHLLVHDLRSPLAIVEAGLGQLLERLDKYGPLTLQQSRVLTRSRRSAIFLRGLIEEIFEVSRLESGQERAEEVTLREVLREALLESIGGVRGPSLEEVSDLSDFDEIRRVLEAQDVHVEVTEEVLATRLRVDRFRLIQVVMNLVGNALKHAPGWLALRVRREGPRLHFAVVDRGPGISSEHREHLFDFHKQVSLKTAGIRRGFGLGLAGAGRLITALGGSMVAEPGDAGIGTQLSFEVPVARHKSS